VFRQTIGYRFVLFVLNLTNILSVRIGVMEDLRVVTLYGMPFQINTKMIINWDEQKATSKMFKTTYNIRMKQLK
jgi:hypothetical protein